MHNEEWYLNIRFKTNAQYSHHMTVEFEAESPMISMTLVSHSQKTWRSVLVKVPDLTKTPAMPGSWWATRLDGTMWLGPLTSPRCGNWHI